MEEDYFIKKIQFGTYLNCGCWANGKSGGFIYFDNNCLYRFRETDKDCKGYLQSDQEVAKSAILACGFIAWVIKNWGKDVQIIYSSYLQIRLNEYKNEHGKDADAFKRDLVCEFYMQYRAKEEQWLKQSEAIFDFIPATEVNKIKKYIQYYFEYVSQFEPETTQVRPLRANDEKPQQQPLTYEHSEALINYKFWHDIETKKHGYVNIFKEINENTFFYMIDNADFSTLNKRGISQRVKYNVFILSRLLGNVWGEKASLKLNTTLQECQKRTGFVEHEELKHMYLQ
jgi:hypothetical protein